MANAIRFLALDAVEKAKSGHPGLPMGMADVATVLWRDVLKFDAVRSPLARSRPVRAFSRPRLHAAYALLYLTGVGGDKGLASTTSSTSGRSARRRRATRNTGAHRASRRRPARSGRGSRPRSAWRSPSACWPRSSRRHRRPSHLCPRFRRRLDGGGEPGSDRHRRPPEALEAHRLLGQQRHLDRRAYVLADNIDQVTRFQSAGWNSTHIDGHDLEAILTPSTPRRSPTGRR